MAGGNPQGYEKVISLLFHRVINKAKVVLFRSTCKNLCQALIFVSLNRKNITSTPPCNCALKNLILALRDSAEALVA